MPAFLQNLNLFPYMDLWRISGKTEVNNKFAGFISLLLLIAVGAIALAKLIEVCQMTTIFATKQSQIQTIAPMINITTSYTDPDMQQYMFAVRTAYFSDAVTYNAQDYSFNMSYTTQSYNNQTKQFSYNNIYYNLQQCTPKHFYKLPDINTNFYDWSMDSWWCLPINLTFQVGGIQLGNYKNIVVNVYCVNTSCQDTGKSIVLQAYTLNTFVNPTNGSTPFTSYITEYETTFQSYATSATFLYFNKNTLNTDNSLLPYTLQSIKNCLQTALNVISNSYPSVQGASATYFITYTGTNVIHTRYYLKFLDALSYLGGIFNALLGAFFFMKTFGCFFFELQFANTLFIKSKVKQITVGTHIKQMVYDFLAIFNKQPDWQSSKYINQMRNTVNKLLDIVYLQRRLQFLERGMEVLFEKHHLRGLYLSYQVTKQGADSNIQNYKIKSQIEQFLSLKTKNAELNNQNMREEQYFDKKLKDQSKIKIKNSTNTQGQLINNDKVLSVQKIKQLKVRQLKIFNQQLQQASIQEDSLKQEDIITLLKLCRQAKQKKGDSRSRKIYEKIDNQLQEILQEALKNQIPSISSTLKL